MAVKQFPPPRLPIQVHADLGPRIRKSLESGDLPLMSNLVLSSFPHTLPGTKCPINLPPRLPPAIGKQLEMSFRVVNTLRALSGAKYGTRPDPRNSISSSPKSSQSTFASAASPSTRGIPPPRFSYAEQLSTARATRTVLAPRSTTRIAEFSSTNFFAAPSRHLRPRSSREHLIRIAWISRFAPAGSSSGSCALKPHVIHLPGRASSARWPAGLRTARA